MRNILILSSVLFITACSGTIQNAYISKAYKKYETHEFKRTLELISNAENAKQTTPDIKAKLTFLKAQTYEGLGQKEKAVVLYEYLKEQHTNSQYGYLASKKLETSL